MHRHNVNVCSTLMVVRGHIAGKGWAAIDPNSGVVYESSTPKCFFETEGELSQELRNPNLRWYATNFRNSFGVCKEG